MEDKAEVVGTVIVLVAMLLVASIAAIGTRRLHFPYTVGLVLLGIGLGFLADRYAFFQPVQSFRLSPDLILYVFLPTLIFESAFNMDSRLLERNLGPAMLLAGPGLLVSTAVVGVGVWWCTGLDLGPALLFGGLISATDPVAVIALFKEVGAPRRLTLLVEGESIFNDATAIVTFQVLMAVLIGGGVGAGALAGGAASFVTVFLGGVLVGALIGFLMVQAIAWLGEAPLVQITISAVVAYASFIAADHLLHVSGVMAVVGAGLVVGWYGPSRLDKATREHVGQFWELAAFLANSLVFLMIGISEEIFLLDLARLSGLAWMTAAVIAIVLLGRAATILLFVPAYNRLGRGQPVDLRSQVVLFWGGLRGAVALALALGLSTRTLADAGIANAEAQRALLLDFTFGVVLFTLIVNAPTMAPLMRLLGLDQPDTFTRALTLQGRIAADRAALARLIPFAEENDIDPSAVAAEADAVRSRLREAEAELATLRAEDGLDEAMRGRLLWLLAFHAERKAYDGLRDHGLLTERTYRERMQDVVTHQERMEAGDGPLAMIDPGLRLHAAGWRRGLRRALDWLQGSAEADTTASYDHEEAILQSSRRVLAVFEELLARTGAAGGAAVFCRTYYMNREAWARSRIDALAKEDPRRVAVLHRRMARLAALDGAIDTLAELADHGALPEDVAEPLLEEKRAARIDLWRHPDSAIPAPPATPAEPGAARDASQPPGGGA